MYMVYHILLFIMSVNIGTRNSLQYVLLFEVYKCIIIVNLNRNLLKNA